MILKISRYLFLLLIVSLPLVRPFNTDLFGLLVPYTDFIFLGAFAFWLLAILTKQTKLIFDKFYLFLAFYLFTLLLSTIFSVDPKHSFYKLLGEIYLISLAILTFNLTQSTEFLKRIVQAWLFGTFLTFLAVLGGFTMFYSGYKTVADNYFLSPRGTLPDGNYPRIHALFANANMMCNYLNISLIFALLAEKLSWLKKTWTRILHLGIWWAAFFTFSPGLGGLFLSLGIWLWSNLYPAKRKTLAISTGMAGIFLALAFFTATLISIDTPNTDQNFKLPFSEKIFEPSVRVLAWQTSLNTFAEFPFTGKGIGTDIASVEYVTISGERQFLTDAHNTWLNQLGQIGLIGFISFFSLCVFLLQRCRFSLKETNETEIIQLALSCAFLGTFWYQSLQGSYEDARHLWILFGLIASFGRNNLDRLFN